MELPTQITKAQYESLHELSREHPDFIKNVWKTLIMTEEQMIIQSLRRLSRKD